MEQIVRSLVLFRRWAEESRKRLRSFARCQTILDVLGLITVCGIASLSAAQVAAPAAMANKAERGVRNIVLVHGAWADGSGWRGVYDILVKDGYTGSIVQEPETSFQEDVAATKRVLAQQNGQCILVAHSYGGAVITEARSEEH